MAPRLDPRARAPRPRIAVALLTGALAGGAACAGPQVAGPAGGAERPELTPRGVRLFHEVTLTLPERGEETLLGNLTFDGPGQFTLRAETPFGVRLFEVGHDGTRLWAELAPPLRGKFPALGLAKSVWRIYYGGCAEGLGCTTPEGVRVVDTVEGAPPHLARRTLEDPGGTRTRIDYADWRPAAGVLHPGRIEMRAKAFLVQIVLSSAEPR